MPFCTWNQAQVPVRSCGWPVISKAVVILILISQVEKWELYLPWSGKSHFREGYSIIFIWIQSSKFYLAYSELLTVQVLILVLV